MPSLAQQPAAASARPARIADSPPGADLAAAQLLLDQRPRMSFALSEIVSVALQRPSAAPHNRLGMMPADAHTSRPEYSLGTRLVERIVGQRARRMLTSSDSGAFSWSDDEVRREGMSLEFPCSDVGIGLQNLQRHLCARHGSRRRVRTRP